MESINKYIEKGLNDLKNEIINRHKADGQVASGDTMRSFVVEKVGEMHYRLVQRGEKFAPAETLDVGRAGGKVPRDFWQIIKRWAEAKGISFQDEKQANRFARSVAWNIHKVGTARHKQNANVVREPLEDFQNEVKKNIVNGFVFEVKKVIFAKK